MEPEIPELRRPLSRASALSLRTGHFFVRHVNGLENLLLIAAGAGLLSFGWVAFGLNTYLAEVDPSQSGHGVTYSGKPIDSTWMWLIVWLSLTLIASTGLPERQVAPRSTGWLAARGSYKGAIFQGLGALVVAGGTGVGHAIGHMFTFSGPGDGCTYPSCWPKHQQDALLLAPGLLAGVAMFAMAVTVRWVPWWVRAVVPVVLWVLALTAQHLVWDSLVPIFEGPPR